MKGELYHAGQPMKVEDFNYGKLSLEQQIRLDRANFTAGIVQDSQSNGETIPFEITSTGGLTINVGTGTAISSGSTDISEYGRERISIPNSDVAPGQNYVRSAGSGYGSGTGTGPYLESSDGLGGWVPTPQPCKTRLIPLSDATTNYVWVGYLKTVDPSVYSLHKITGAKLYTQANDGYDIIVTTSPLAPSFNGNNNYILIGTVTTLSGVVSSISQTRTSSQFSKMLPHRIGIAIDSTQSPSTYASGETKFLDDHINAHGTGPGVSARNPHSVGIEDIGYRDVDVNLAGHRKYHHSHGIIGVAATLTSSLYPRTDNATPVNGDIGMVFLKQLIAGEQLILDGEYFTEVTPKLTGGVGGAASGDAYVSFATGLTAGVYTIYLYISGGEAVLGKRLGTTINANELGICTVTWSGVAFTDGGGPPNVNADLRLFGITGTKDLQQKSVASDKIALADNTSGQNPASGSGVKQSHIQNQAVVSSHVAPAGLIVPDTAQDVTTGSGIATGHIRDEAVTQAKLATDSVSTVKIQNASVISNKIDLADNTSGQNVATGSGIKQSHIQDQAVVSSHISPAGLISPITAQDVTTGSGIATGHIRNNSVTRDKLDSVLQSSFVPPGSVLAFAGVEGNLPPGFVLCDGRQLNGDPNGPTPQYNNLWSAIANTWGGSGYLFLVPDLRGMFLRGANSYGAGAATAPFYDPDSSSRTRNDGTTPASGVGSYQMDIFRSHSHSGGRQDPGGGGLSADGSLLGNTGASGGNETRPKNAYVLYMIKI